MPRKLLDNEYTACQAVMPGINHASKPFFLLRRVLPIMPEHMLLEARCQANRGINADAFQKLF